MRACPAIADRACRLQYRAADAAGSEAEILSDEALERVTTGLQSLFGRAAPNQPELSTSPRLAKLEEEAQELRTLVKKGRPSSVAAQAALDAIERERTELAFQSSRDERRVYEEAIPNAWHAQSDGTRLLRH